MRSLKIASFLVAAFSVFTLSHAQAIPGISNPLTVSVAPSAPRANEPITVVLQSYSFDINRALVTWSIDGKEQRSGVGEKQFTFLAGPLGSTKILTIAATVPGSGTFTETVVIRPAEVGLVWESDTYVPPFYKGKALHSYNGSFKVIALPEFYSSPTSKIDPRELIYTWKKNGQADAAASGYGKSSYTTSQTSYLREGEEISVEVSAPLENLVATRSITVIPAVPKVVFYENSPLYGIIYEKSLSGTFSLENEEVTIEAEPYFFSAQNKRAAALSYAWTLGDERLADFNDEPALTLRKSGDSSGAARVSLTMQSAARLLQGAQAALTIRYE